MGRSSMVKVQNIMKKHKSTASFFLLLLGVWWILKLYGFLWNFFTVLSLNLIFRGVFYLWIFGFLGHLILYPMADRVKQFIDVGAVFGTGFEKDTISEFVSNIFPFLIADNPLCLQIDLIACKRDDHIRRRVIIDILDPFGEIGEGLPISNRVNLHNKPKSITSNIASAPWYTVPVKFLNLSCPAVSQICSLSLNPSTSTNLTLKSMPIVAMWLRLIYEWM